MNFRYIFLFSTFVLFTFFSTSRIQAQDTKLSSYRMECKTKSTFIGEPLLKDNDSKFSFLEKKTAPVEKILRKSAVAARSARVATAGVSLEVNVDTAGLFARRLSELGYSSSDVEELKVTGVLDSMDLAFISQMSSLRSLDLWNVTLPGNRMPDFAFLQNICLNSVKLPAQLTSTGIGTFYGCTSLKEVVYSELLSKIEMISFAMCGFTSVAFSGTIKSIDVGAFQGCPDLSSVNFSEGLKTIGEDAFSDCALSELVFPSTLDSIGLNAFSGNAKLKVVKSRSKTPPVIDYSFEENIQSETLLIVPDSSVSAYEQTEWNSFKAVIGWEHAFPNIRVQTPGSLESTLAGKGCESSSIINLTLSGLINEKDIYFIRDSLTALDSLDLFHTAIVGDSLPENAFMGTEYTEDLFDFKPYTAILLPEGLKRIGTASFAHCSGIRSLLLPKYLEEIGDDAFWNCANVEISIHPENTHFKLVDSVLYSSDGRKLYFYPYSRNDTVFTIPDGVETVVGGAFLYSKNKEVHFPATIRMIGQNAFYQNTNLEIIDLSGCIHLDTIGYRSFELKRKPGFDRFFYLPDNVKLIDSRAFGFFKYLNVPENIEEIGSYVFTDADSVYIPNQLPQLKHIGDGSFVNVAKAIRFPVMENLTSVGWAAFLGCTGPEKIKLSPKIDSIGEGAFCGIQTLKYIDVDAANPRYSSLNGILYNKNQSVIMAYCAGKSNGCFRMPNSIKSVASLSFYKCLNLYSVLSSDSLKSIDDFAFMQCPHLGTIAIPKTLVRIGEKAFSECSSLREILIKAIKPPLIDSEDEGFDHETTQSCRLFVPKGTISLYREDPAWNAFSHITEQDDSATVSLETTMKGNFGFFIQSEADRDSVAIDWGGGKLMRYEINTDSTYIVSPAPLLTDTTLVRLYGSKIRGLYLQQKKIITLDVKNATNLKYLDCSNNLIPLSSLPVPRDGYTLYRYAPQIHELPAASFVKDAIDMGSNTYSVSPGDSLVKSSFAWKTTAGKVLRNGIDYYINTDGICFTVFTSDQADSVYGEFSNALFPDQNGIKPIRTTKTFVDLKPTVIIKARRKGNTFSFSAALTIWSYFADLSDTMFVDWGDKKKVQYKLKSLSTYTSNYYSTKDTTTIKIFAEAIGNLKMPGMNVVDLDVSNAVYLDRLECNMNELNELDLSNNGLLMYIWCTSNPMTKLKFCESNWLDQVICTQTLLDSIDLSGTAISSLKCESARLKYLNLDGCTSLGTLWVDNNQLTRLDLRDCKYLNQVFCQRNLLEELVIGESGVSILNCSSNRLTYATLPLPELVRTNYVYGGQENPVVPDSLKMGEVLDLSFMKQPFDSYGNEYPNKFSFTKITPDTYSSCIKDTDYTVLGNGQFSFINPKINLVCCNISNDLFPDLRFRTANIKITPADIVASAAVREASTVVISPNPSKDYFVVHNLKGEAQLSIYSMTGTRLTTRSVMNGDPVSVSELKDGIYVVRVETGDETLSLKLIKRGGL